MPIFLREAILARLTVPDSRVSCHNMGKQVLAMFPVILCSCLRGDRHRGEVVESHRVLVFLFPASHFEEAVQDACSHCDKEASCYYHL